MLGRKSKYEKRDYLKQFKIGKATYSESLIYEAYGGLQNDGIMLAVYYDVDATKIVHQLDSWEKINDSPTISSILKNVSSYFGLDFKIPEIASGNFFLYDNEGQNHACNGQHHISREGFNHGKNSRFKTGWFGADLLCDVAHLRVHIIKQAGKIGHDRRCQQRLDPI